MHINEHIHIICPLFKVYKALYLVSFTYRDTGTAHLGPTSFGVGTMTGLLMGFKWVFAS